MIRRINGRLYSIYGVPKKINKKLSAINLKLSLLVILMGIFLLPNSAYLSSVQPETLIDLTNQARLAAGLSSLTANQLLTQAAILKGQAILASDTFGHTINNKKFSSWIIDAGYNYTYVGENLAVDFNTSEGIIEAWKNSPLHRKNLLSPYYQEIGISALSGKFQGQDTTIVVQIFGTPAQPAIFPKNENFDLTFSGLTKDSVPENKTLSKENLLTNAATNKQTLPENYFQSVNSFADYQTETLNTFVAQSNYRIAINNLLMLFLTLMTAYLIILLYSYYLIRINRQLAV